MREAAVGRAAVSKPPATVDVMYDHSARAGQRTGAGAAAGAAAAADRVAERTARERAARDAELLKPEGIDLDIRHTDLVLMRRRGPEYAQPIQTVIRRVGSSVGLIIPRALAAHLGLHEGLHVTAVIQEAAPEGDDWMLGKTLSGIHAITEAERTILAPGRPPVARPPAKPARRRAAKPRTAKRGAGGKRARGGRRGL